jgi:Ca-activated chloride channel family protein
LHRALALPKAEGASRTVVIVTDGYVSVETETFDLIRNKLGEANMFAFGIGSSVNRFIIEGIARVGMGEPYVLTKPAEARAKAEKFRKVIATPVLSNVKADFGGFDAYDVEPPAIPDVLAERPVIVFGKWRGKAEGKIRVTGKTGEDDFEKIISIGGVTPGDNQNALRSLWARWRIAVLSDYQKLSPSDDRKKAVTDLGLEYNLLTAYTSFVAIDSQVRAKGEKPTTVKQPLPLPEGVSNLAVGRSYGVMARKSMAMPQAAPAPPGTFRLKKAEGVRADAAPAETAVAAAPESEPMERDKEARRARPFAIEKVTVEAGISEESVRKAVEGARTAIDACLRAAALAGNGGMLELSISVGANGKVKSVKVLGSISNADALEKCLAMAFRGATLDRPAGATSAEIRVVLKL